MKTILGIALGALLIASAIPPVRAQARDCGASGVGCLRSTEIEWINKAGEIFPNGSGLGHRAFGTYCARHPSERKTCLADPWRIVAKLKIDRAYFDQR